MSIRERRLLLDQREANEQLVMATLRAQEAMEQAEAAQATAEAATRRAEASERELRRTAEFRELFLGMLGHDLRSPLSGIVMTAAALVARGHLDDADTKRVVAMERSARRMARLITQLLDFTRVRLGDGLSLVRAPVDLRDICSGAVGEIDADETARVELLLQGNLAGTWDADRLSQVVSNLLGNALQHAAPGTSVVVEARGKGEVVVLEVRNQGEPIPPELLPHIFEAFRGTTHGAPRTRNLGLGLYIADQIVRAHGGTIAARSAGGTTAFTLRLPRVMS